MIFPLIIAMSLSNAFLRDSKSLASPSLITFVIVVESMGDSDAGTYSANAFQSGMRLSRSDWRVDNRLLRSLS